jgi:hypothetical protein
MTPLYTIAHDIDQALGGTACRDAIEASTFDHSLVLWRFLAAVLREMKPGSAKTQAAIDPVIEGLDRLARGEEWPEADAADAAWAEAARAPAPAAWAELAVTTEAARTAAAWAAWAAAWAEAARAATFADVPRARQRDIFLRLIQEASQ